MKILSLVLMMVLVGSSILSVPLVYADTQLDSLLRIANQARDNIKIRLSQLSVVPDEINNLYKKGSAETDAIEQSIKDGDTSSAKQHFLAAMKLFKETSDKITSSEKDEPQVDLTKLNNAISRMEKAAEKLKTVAAKNNIALDFTEFNKLIQIARENLQAGNVEEVNKTLGIAKQFILDANNSISTAAKQRTQDRARDFATKQIERLDKLIIQAKDLGLSQDIIDTLQDAKEKLQKVSDFDQIVNQTKGFKNVQDKLDQFKVNRINAIIFQLEKKTKQLYEDAQDDDSKTRIANTRNNFVELKQLVSNGKLDDALKMIKSIEETLRTMENTNVTSSALTSSTGVNKETNVALEQKDRLKIKIQNIEEVLNNLSDKVTDNEVASQWLKRAFSLVESAKNQLEKSPDKAQRTIMDVERIIKMIQKTI